MLLERLGAATASYQVAHGSNSLVDKLYENLINFLFARCKALNALQGSTCQCVDIE